MTQFQQPLDENIFQSIKQNIIRQISSTTKDEIVNNTDTVIKGLQRQNNYQLIDIDWENFKIASRWIRNCQTSLIN